MLLFVLIILIVLSTILGIYLFLYSYAMYKMAIEKEEQN